jgi:hypothetical protein
VEFGQSASHDNQLYLEAAENRPNWFRLSLHLPPDGEILVLL